MIEMEKFEGLEKSLEIARKSEKYKAVQSLVKELVNKGMIAERQNKAITWNDSLKGYNMSTYKDIEENLRKTIESISKVLVMATGEAKCDANIRVTNKFPFARSELDESKSTLERYDNKAATNFSKLPLDLYIPMDKLTSIYHKYEEVYTHLLKKTENAVAYIEFAIIDIGLERHRAVKRMMHPSWWRGPY